MLHTAIQLQALHIIYFLTKLNVQYDLLFAPASRNVHFKTLSNLKTMCGQVITEPNFCHMINVRHSNLYRPGRSIFVSICPKFDLGSWL